jgi:hypothetical protein
LKVDDEDVGLDDFQELLIGSDVPGTFVKITVWDPDAGIEKEVMLTRMATSAIADNVRMFEFFAALKVCVPQLTSIPAKRRIVRLVVCTRT